MLKGKRVSLRTLGEKDIPLLLKWFNDIEITQYLNRPVPLYEQEEKEWLANVHKRKETDLVFGIEDEKGELIGNIGLHRIDRYNQTAVLGIAIGKKDVWGQGYGRDAIMALLEYAFRRLNLFKVRLSVFDFNSRGQRCYEACGFVEEGRLRQERFHDWKRVDEILMSVFKNDFKKLLKKRP